MNAAKRPTHVWVFESNRRVYADRSNIGQGPIYREHWVQREIVGETARSWVDKFGKKYPKASVGSTDARRNGFLWSQEAVELNVWVHEHRHKLASLLNHGLTDEQVAAVAEAIEYEHQPPSMDTFGL